MPHSKLARKTASVALALSTALWLSGAVMVLPAAGQTAQSVLQQIANLQAQLAALRSGSASSTCTFTRSLHVGSRGQDVQCLQQYLNAHGYPVAASGAGSAGNETTYYGRLTANAVAKWQAAANISPASGYFGPLSRAKFSAMAAASPAPTGTPAPTGSPVPSASPVPAPVTGQVTITAGTNNGGSIIVGASQIPVLNFNVANGTTGDVTVNGLQFTKTGVVSDSNISNAYLSLGNNIVAQYVGLSGGVITFSGGLFTVKAGQTVSATLRVDLSTSASNGNTISFNLAGASAVTLSGGTVAGSFPIQGGTYVATTVTNPSLASISSPTYQGVAGTVYAGQTGFRAAALTFTVQNSPVKLNSIRFTVSGSVNYATDLQNLNLRVNGTQVASSSLSSSGQAFFDLSANPAVLGTGSQLLEVYADVMGTPNRTFQFQILRPFDWVLTDTQYNTNVNGGTPSGTATTVNVGAGTVTASQDVNTPTGNVARGATSVTIAKFDIHASGEAIKLLWLPFQLSQTGGTSNWAALTNVDTDIHNIAIFGDDGSQLGSTISTPSACSYGTPTVVGNAYQCSFGSPTSNINYIIPANTTRVLSLKVDVQSGGAVTALTGQVVAPAGGWAGSNVQGQISFQTSSTPGGTISGSTLSISANPFQAAQNAALATQTFVAGVTQAKIASFSLSASSAEGINVTSVSVKTSANVGGTLLLQNLVAKVGSTSWNYTQPTVAASTVYTFSSPGGPTTIPTGGSMVVDVYADILTNSSATTFTTPIVLTGAVGVGATTNSNQTLASNTTPVTSSAPVNGQNLTVSGGGVLTASVDASIPPAQQIVLGSTGVTVGQFRFAADNTESEKITDLTITASGSSVSSPATFQNLTFWSGSTQVGTGTALSGSNGLYTSAFHFATPLIVAPNQTNVYTLKADTASYTASPSSHNQTYNFQIATPTSVTAYGAASNVAHTATTSSGVTFPLSSNALTTQHTKLTAALATLGATTGRTPNAADDIGTMTLSVDPAYGAQFTSVQFTLSGTALATSTISLIDNDTGSTIATSAISSASTTPTLTASPAYLITAGTSKIFRIRVNSANFTPVSSSNQAPSLSVQIASAGGLVWATQGVSESLNLEARVIPLTISIAY